MTLREGLNFLVEAHLEDLDDNGTGTRCYNEKLKQATKVIPPTLIKELLLQFRILEGNVKAEVLKSCSHSSYTSPYYGRKVCDRCSAVSKIPEDDLDDRIWGTSQRRWSDWKLD